MGGGSRPFSFFCEKGSESYMISAEVTEIQSGEKCKCWILPKGGVRMGLPMELPCLDYR